MNRPNQQQAKHIIDGLEEKLKANDIDGFMEHFAEDAVYVEYTGKVNKGKKEIRKSFVKWMFKGDFGKITFEDEDFYTNEKGDKATQVWWCIHNFNGKIMKFKGIDIYRFDNGLIIDKRAYVQTYAYGLKLYPRNIILMARFMFYVIIQKIIHPFTKKCNH